MYFIYNLHYFFLRQMSFLSNMDTLIKYYLFLSQFSNCFLLLWSNSSQNIFWAVRFSFVYGIQLMPTLTFDAVLFIYAINLQTSLLLILFDVICATRLSWTPNLSFASSFCFGFSSVYFFKCRKVFMLAKSATFFSKFSCGLTNFLCLANFNYFNKS